MDTVSAIRLSLVHPVLAAKVQAMTAALAADGITIRVIQGLRTLQEQNADYAKGRTAPGSIVTNARGGQSWHNYGLAVDCAPGIRGAAVWTPNWDASSLDWETMISAGEAQGLIAGARWTSFPDRPHFQLPNIPVSPDDAARTLLSAGSMKNFWAKYGPLQESA
ncbi:hypothetical protein GCM10011507_35050 [Edaphobacter acidisoli]|uniref:Peptidase M15C domain-containing protein n=1 Tax=Edaphobacter acidisoli TaxID=2040573 RepID=A0A916WAL2_9BACT|nr:M15 family metallopeptidase [Edaphobacter acidisoli]GGA80826.1 hypothetical protein GCM10011507_35050 [Edaphobacter acidisoli]